jgi:hypothetical protein
MTHLALLRGVLAFPLCVSIICGCGAPSRTSSTAGSTAPVSPEQADTEMTCVRSHDAGAWTQLVYRTQTWRDLAERADRHDANAWREIANLIERNRQGVKDTACTDRMLQDVRATAARLAAATSTP